MCSFFEKKLNYYKNRRPEMLSYLPSHAKRFLEIGCGGGEFAALVKGLYSCSEYWGVEISEAAAKAAEIYIDKIIVGDMEETNIYFPDGYFDCVILNDVLEHFKDPWGVLRRVSNLVTENGRVVASIPNVRFFYTLKNLVISKKWNYEHDGVHDIAHLRFFTESSIRDLFESSGFSIDRLEGINPIVFPWKFRLFNTFLCGIFNDTRFLQFACVAKCN